MIFYQLGFMPLLNPDEGRNASIAWEMQQAGNWLIPTYNGVAYLDKPSFFFKLVAFSLSLFGHSEFAARLPSALFAVGTLLLVFGFCRREYDLRTAALAVAVVSTTPLFIGFARYVIFDMTLAFFVCAAIFAGYFAESAEGNMRRRWGTLAVCAMGFATLVKGPVGFIVPLLVLTVSNRVDGKRGAIKRLLCRHNLLLFLALVLPWFIGVSLQHHDFPYYGVFRESLLRFTTDKFLRAQPFYFYLPVILLAMLFWSLLLPQTLWLSWRQRSKLSRADRLLIVWAVVVTLFFSISQSKLPGYILTGVIALGILIARKFCAAFDNPDEMVARSGAFLLALLSSAGAASLFFYQTHTWPRDSESRFSDAADLMSELHTIALPSALWLSCVAASAIYAALWKNARVGFLAFIACPVLLVTMLLPCFAESETHRSDDFLAQEILQIAPHEDVACYLCFPPGIPFYLGRSITVFSNNNGGEIASNYIQFSLAQQAPWPHQIQPVGQFESWMSQRRKPVFLMAEKPNVPVLETIAAVRHGQVHPLAGGRYWGLFVTPTDGR
jgi:4-amino-4-deoxy-L-arabinose transferase-like glycosyltransferase